MKALIARAAQRSAEKRQVSRARFNYEVSKVAASQFVVYATRATKVSINTTINTVNNTLGTEISTLKIDKEAMTNRFTKSSFMEGSKRGRNSHNVAMYMLLTIIGMGVYATAGTNVGIVVAVFAISYVLELLASFLNTGITGDFIYAANKWYEG